MGVITENSKVTVHYIGKLSDGQVFDASMPVEGDENFTGREPIDVELGKKMVIPGFEKALQGMQEGDTKTVTIPSAEAYGEVSAQNLHEIEKDRVPNTVKEGDILQSENDGQVAKVIVKEVKENTVVLDANHPLAGKDLTFELKVVSVS